MLIQPVVCSREKGMTPCLQKFWSWAWDHREWILYPDIYCDTSSIYESYDSGYQKYASLDSFTRKNELVFIFMHDDVEIISTPYEVSKYLELALKPGVGFVGVAGATELNSKAIWWESRKTGNTRGFVFQGNDPVTMTPNWFGVHGQTLCLDGCFMAASYNTLEKLGGIKKPKYLSSNWDFYDISTTFEAHLKGFNNYTVPIIVRHESPGLMREGWETSRQEFIKEFRPLLPCRLPVDKTQGYNGLLN